jgi:hypothetical protein
MSGVILYGKLGSRLCEVHMSLVVALVVLVHGHRQVSVTLYASVVRNVSFAPINRVSAEGVGGTPRQLPN